MVTSRTGTASYKKWRQKLIYRAKQNGQTSCPLCNQTLAWNTHHLPNSPESDHIIPYHLGGKNTIENGRIICRKCNYQLGQQLQHSKKHKQKRRKKIHTTTLQTAIDW